MLKRWRERWKLRSSTRLTITSFLPEGLIVNASEQLKASEFQYKLAASATSALHASKTFTEHHFVRVTPSCNKDISRWDSSLHASECDLVWPALLPNAWGWVQEQQTQFTWAFDNRETLVIEMFSELTHSCFLKYRSTEVNLQKPKNQFGYSRRQKRGRAWFNRKTGTIFYKADIWRLHRYVLSLLEWN